MKTKSAETFVMGLLFICGAAVPAQADTVIFSNLGPNDSYDQYHDWAVGSGGPGYYWVPASAFTVGASVNLSTIEVAAGYLSGNQLTINLDADSGGTPGSVIESFTINGAMPFIGSVSSGDLVMATSVLHPLLTAGSQYWVVLSVPNDRTSEAAWNFNSTSDTGPFYGTNDGATVLHSTETRGAMRVTGQSTPEPSSIVMASTSVLLMLGCFLRRRSTATAA